MALDRTRHFCEFLIRGREDGSLAAHVVYRNRVVLDGEVLKDEPEQPAPVALDNLDAVKGIIGDAIVVASAAQDAAIAEREKIREESTASLLESAKILAAEQARATDLEGKLSAAQLDLESAETGIAARDERIAQMESDETDARTRIKELTAQVDRLTAEPVA